MSEERPVKDMDPADPVPEFDFKDGFSLDGFDDTPGNAVPIDTVPREQLPDGGAPRDSAPAERPVPRRIPQRGEAPAKTPAPDGESPDPPERRERQHREPKPQRPPREPVPEKEKKDPVPEKRQNEPRPEKGRKAPRPEKRPRGPGVLGVLAAMNPIATAAVAAVVLIALVLGLSWYLGTLNGMKNGIGESFSQNKDAMAAEVRDNIYSAGYGRGFEENHVENSVAIRIDQVRQTGRLQIMRVRSSAYVIDDGAENVSWLKAVGEGVYTVDLAAGEYITDPQNRYVLVRVPAPELTDVTLVSTEQLHYRNNRLIGNGSVEEGEKLAMSQRSRALAMLREDLRSNTTVTASLNDTAQDLISALVRSLNPDIAELTVEVEFF